MKVAVLLRTGAASFLLAAVLLVPAAAVHAATLTVNSTGDAGDATPGDGVCETAPANGVCTLRAAIEEANAFPGADTIAFGILGGGLHTIQPTSALPIITDPLEIDGYTQPGAIPNTNDTSLGLNTVLMIELDGSLAGDANGLHFTAGHSAVRGLAINSFSGPGHGILVETKGANTIEGNFVGTDVTGMVALGNRQGVQIRDGASNNAIGGPTPEARNLISGNQRFGIRLTDNGTTDNVVQGNLIGTDVTGTVALGNGGRGIRIRGGASNNTIGGLTAGARNLISGNVGHGIRMADVGTTGNVVQGNFIGTDVTGTMALGNTNTGVHIRGGASDNVVGGTVVEARNVISGNGVVGVRLSRAATGNKVRGNFIGTDVTGTVALGNGRHGVVIKLGASDNLISGNTASYNAFDGFLITNSSDNTLEGNSASSNGNNGYSITDNSSGNTLEGNTASNNANRGFVLNNSSDNRLETNTAIGSFSGFSFFNSSTNTVDGNSATGNTSTGFALNASWDNTLVDNTATDNGFAGFFLRDSFDNALGDNTATGHVDGFHLNESSRNILTDNTANENNAGFVFRGAFENTLVDNTADENRLGFALFDSSSDNTLNNNTADDNVFSGFALFETSFDNTLDGNTASGNSDGFDLRASSGNTLVDNTGNNNASAGFSLIDSSSGNILTGNAAIDNDFVGFFLEDSPGNTLEGNTANDNAFQGIHVEAGSTDNVISANEALGNGGFDLFDGHGNCASNTWSANTFGTKDPACIS